MHAEDKLFKLAPNKATRVHYTVHSNKLYKKLKGTLGQKFFSARVIDSWNGLDDGTAVLDTVTALKRKLEKMRY